MLHTPGTYLEIPREDAADNPSVACSFGLHCAPWVHVKNHYDNYGTKVELLLDPKDVVSVPHDGRGEKIRVCRYKILREMKAGDEPLKDVLAKMKRKTTAEGKELREKAAKLTKVALDFDGGNLVVPPDVMIAAGIEPKDKAQVYVMQGYAIIGKMADTEVLAKQVQRNVGKFDGAKAVPAAISPRCSISIEGALLRNMTKDGSTFAQYEAEITSLNKRKIIRLTAIESAGLTKQSAKLKEVKKAGVKEKATRKVEKKTAKKATKKKAAKKAAKKTAKK
jgi:bifunctional DNA-binding transcriptional regulator/antitoxin component of YhaV-PrlF toxin-antitoxin module